MKALCKRINTNIWGVIEHEDNTTHDWPEVLMNNYAVFGGYLSLAAKGLGYLVVTWTTVVLLGGFVSMLNQKDFWSLTVIMLVQTVRVLDVSAERLRNIGYSIFGLLVSIPLLVSRLTRAKKLAILIGTFVQALVFVLVLCPLGAAYMFGPVISAGLSMWRLIQRDYVDALDTDPDKKNMRPALNVLYSLALLQGGHFLYRAIFSTRAKAITQRVADSYSLLDDEEACLAVTDYFRETTVGLEKDPSFARIGQWNLFTYAVGLLESRSDEKYLSGARLLHKLLHQSDSADKKDLAKRLLLGSPFAGTVVSKLLWTLDPAAPYGKEAREHAASIVGILAGEFHLEQFPRGLRRIKSLLDNSNTLELQKKGKNILIALAANDEDNRRAIRDEA